MLRQLLKPECVRLGLRGGGKAEIIGELLDILEAAGRLPDRAGAEKAVLDREALASTGLESGLALPHARTDTVRQMTVALALVPDGLEFASADGRPAQILALILSPTAETGQHIRLMAEFSKLMRNDGKRQRLLAATSPAAACAILQENDQD